MPHLPKIGVKNFKLFKEKKDFTFRSITLLTGTNSSGKTSVIQAMRLLKNFLRGKKLYSASSQWVYGRLDYIERLSLEQIGDRLGDFSKLYNNSSSGSQRKTISFDIPSILRGIVDSITVTLSITQSSGKLNEGELTGIALHSAKHGKTIFYLQLVGGRWDTQVDYGYFWGEFSRECTQMKKYLALLEKANQIRNNGENYVPGELTTLLPEMEEKLAEIHKQMDLVHPDFFRVSGWLGISSDGNDSYVPFFSEGSVIPDLTEGLFTVTFREAEADALQEREAFLLKYALHSDADVEKWLRVMEKRLLKNFSFSTFPSEFEGHLYSVFQCLGNPAYALWKDSNFHRWTAATGNLQPLSDLLQIEGTYIALKSAPARSYKLRLGEEVDDSSMAKTFFSEFVSQNILFALQHCTEYFTRLSHLPSIRNIVKRAYSNQREETVFSGLILQFLELGIESAPAIMEFLNYYIRVFEIGEKILIVRDEEGISSRFYVVKDGKKVLLADLGHGISQFIPILLNIAIHAMRYQDIYYGEPIASIMCIEEPETNLHPALQSRLADLFVDASKRFNIQFIVETHSEYLIRKLQYLVGKGDSGFASQDVLLYYFEKQKGKSAKKCVKEIKINPDGSLSDDFGEGFYDEALHWKFELVKLKNPQYN